MVYPLEICFPDPESGRWAKYRLVGEHHFYLVYENEETLKRILVPKSIVYEYVDMSKCYKSQ